MSTGKEPLSLTLCPSGFFNKPDTLEALDDSSSDIGHSLQSLETRSLSIVHELVHACKGPDGMKIPFPGGLPELTSDRHP